MRFASWRSTNSKTANHFHAPSRAPETRRQSFKKRFLLESRPGSQVHHEAAFSAQAFEQSRLPDRARGTSPYDRQESSERRLSQVPRHREIKTTTARAICKDLNLEPPSES